jgi:probable FeS assembly SUF system protein SufT
MAEAGASIEEAVWRELRTVFDPEIPVNIVDLGLIYGCSILPLAASGHRVEIRMTLTAPGCAMADVIKAEVERKLAQIPGVSEVRVAVVFDPPWDKSRMSEAAKLQLGFDLDIAPSPSALPIWKPLK